MFNSGGLTGTLWSFANGWSATTSVDHDTIGSGTVTSSASLAAPALSILSLPGVPDGAVKVGRASPPTPLLRQVSAPRRRP